MGREGEEVGGRTKRDGGGEREGAGTEGGGRERCVCGGGGPHRKRESEWSVAGGGGGGWVGREGGQLVEWRERKKSFISILFIKLAEGLVLISIASPKQNNACSLSRPL